VKAVAKIYEDRGGEKNKNITPIKIVGV